MDSVTRERRTRWRIFSIVATLSLTGTLAVAATPASAVSQTSVVSDPAGDAFHAPGFMDVVRAEVTKTGTSFEFRTTLAEPIPANPQLPPGCKRILWAWGIDTDLTTFPKGYPAAPGYFLQVEFVLSVEWNGTAFSGVLVDRRPLLNGGEAVITQRPFTITSSEVQMVVDASELGSPTSFLWDALTECWSGPPGSLGVHFTDFTDPFFNPSPS